MPTTVTPKLASQSRSASRLRVVVPKVWVSWWRLPCAPGTRTQAVTESLCTSRPAQRSTIWSIPLLLPVVRRSLLAESLSCVLVATVKGA